MTFVKFDSELFQIHLGNLWSSSYGHKDIIELMFYHFLYVELIWLFDADNEFVSLFSYRLSLSQLKLDISVLHVVDNLPNNLLVK
jgi:hypothetical protein